MNKINRKTTTTVTEPKSKNQRSKHKRAKPKATRTHRLADRRPLYAHVTIAREESDMHMERKTYCGYVTDSIAYDGGLVLSKEIDGFPFIELFEKTIELIEYVDPDEKPKIYQLALDKEK